MPMGAVQAVVMAGINANMQTPSATETVVPVDDLVLHVKNTSGSAITVTITDAGNTPAGSAATNVPMSVPATSGEMFKYIPVAAVNPATGLVTATFSSTTGVTAEWLRV